jgi:hypothetical protein
MVTKRYMQLLLLVIFALLQGMAPLAHAHINGHSEDHHIHLAELDAHPGHVYEQASPTATVGEDHARTVGMQPEFRSNKLELAKIALPDAIVLPAVISAESACCFPVIDTPRATSFHFHHPVSQAPPAC